MTCKEIKTGLGILRNVKFSAEYTRLSRKKYDIGLFYLENCVSWYALFTKNKIKAAPVLYDMHLLNDSKPLKAVLVNSGNANACNRNGFRAIDRIIASLAEAMNIDKDTIFVSSTGIIGEDLDYENIIKSFDSLVHGLNNSNHSKFAEAILTTDTFTKEFALECSYQDIIFHIGGVAKGSGMIHPDMATMLAFLGTDLNINQKMLGNALQYAVNHSFNRISVDGDTSTNDTVIIFSTGDVENELVAEDTELFRFFMSKLTDVCVNLAKSIVLDGEGATKMVEIIVFGAEEESDAANVALSVANSNLVKTAIFGNDPNWGRILAACGYANANISENKISISIGDYIVFSKGNPLGIEKSIISEYMKKNREIKIYIDLNSGIHTYNMWFSDLTYDYVKINAEYHT